MNRTRIREALIAATLSAASAGVQAQSVGAATPPEAHPFGGLEEIVVTAQRRAQNLQDVPVAVTMANGAQLAEAQVFNISNISAISPSISFDAANNSSVTSNIKIRGIGTVGQNRAFEGAVGVFIDGVYRSRAGQALQNWLDVESVQVLRGPQGTLFGKNTSAGAFLLTSNTPNTENVEGDYEFSFGNYEMMRARAAINAPLNDKVAVRVAGAWETSRGYLEDPNTGDDLNDRHPKAFKAQILYEATPDLTFRLIGDWSEENQQCCAAGVVFVPGVLQPLIDGLQMQRGQRPPSKDVEDYEATISTNSQHITDQGAVLLIDWSPSDSGSLRSITSYRRWHYDNPDLTDGDLTGANIVDINEPFTTEAFSQEVTWNGKLAWGRSIDYVAGLYYSHETLETSRQAYWGGDAQIVFDTLLGGAGLPPGTASASQGLWMDEDFPGESDSYAAFLHADVALTDAFDLIAGARYSRDKKRGEHQTTFFDPAPNAVLNLLGVYPGPDYDSTYEDSAVSGTFGFQYRFNDGVMSYLTYSRGYKSGGVTLDASAAGLVANNPALVPGAQPLDPRYKPEYVDGYELGLKSQYLDNRARTNVALFYNDIKDLQVAQFIGLQFTVINAPEATVYGAEFENSFVLTDWLTMGVDALWLKEAQYGEAAELGPLSDRRFYQAPELTGNLSFTLDVPVSADLHVTSRLAAEYSGEQYINTADDELRGSETEYNLSIGLKSVASNWSINAWCQNCTDERYVVQALNYPIQPDGRHGFVAAPRTYGLTLRGAF